MGLFGGIANYFTAKKNAKLAQQAKTENMANWNQQVQTQADKSVFRPFNISMGSATATPQYDAEGKVTGMSAGLTGAGLAGQNQLYGASSDVLGRQPGMFARAEGLYGQGAGMLAGGQRQLDSVLTPEQYGQGMLDRYSTFSRPRQQQAFADAGAQAYMGGSIGNTTYDPVTGAQMSPWAAAAERVRSDQDYQAYLDSLKYGTGRQASERDYGFNLMKQGGNLYGIGNEMGGQGLKMGDQGKSLWAAAMAGDEQALNALRTSMAGGEFVSNLNRQIYNPHDFSGSINTAAAAQGAKYGAAAGTLGGIADTALGWYTGGASSLAQLARHPGAPIEQKTFPTWG